jgi:hypothetical protein
VNSSGEANYGWNGLALLALSALPSPPADRVGTIRRLTSGLLAVKGIAIESDPKIIKQNSQLQAWSWVEGTFSWIEPTAYCLLALKKVKASGPDAAARMADAEAVILDRVCASGGWNYGNSQVFSQDLRPYVPTTALALLAMQDKRAHPAVTQSLDWLVVHALSERSAMALSLAALALHVYGRPTKDVLAALAQDDAKTGFLGNVQLMAMASYALSLPSHDARAVTL